MLLLVTARPRQTGRFACRASFAGEPEDTDRSPRHSGVSMPSEGGVILLNSVNDRGHDMSYSFLDNDPNRLHITKTKFFRLTDRDCLSNPGSMT